MFKRRLLLIVLSVFLVFAGCSNTDDENHRDDSDQTPVNGDVPGDDPLDDYVGDPWYLFEQTHIDFFYSARVVEADYQGTVSLSQAQTIFKDRWIENEGMIETEERFDFSGFGYDSTLFDNPLYFIGEHYLTKMGFKERAGAVEVLVVSISIPLYRLPNTTQGYLALINHPAHAEELEVKEVWDMDIVIDLRSGMSLEDIMSHYLSEVDSDHWEIRTDSWYDEGNIYYNWEGKEQIIAINTQFGYEIEVYIDLTTLRAAQEHYKEGHYLITVGFHNVVRYLIDE